MESCMPIFNLVRRTGPNAGQKKAAAGLVVVDMQHPVLMEKGEKEGYENASRLILNAKNLGLPIALIRYSKSKHPVNPFIRKIVPGAPVIKKDSFDAFESKELVTFLESNLLEKRVVVVGFNRVECVKATALGGARTGYEVFIPIDATVGSPLNTCKDEIMFELELKLESNIKIFERSEELLSHLARILQKK
ncbi:MAG: isochorismatase family protein [Candidatus Micrarchaeota archaeon]|nr:isochorismatase family protein [Candidatus Micrarchaeota archaeon]